MDDCQVLDGVVGAASFEKFVVVSSVVSLCTLTALVKSSTLLGSELALENLQRVALVVLTD